MHSEHVLPAPVHASQLVSHARHWMGAEYVVSVYVPAGHAALHEPAYQYGVPPGQVMQFEAVLPKHVGQAALQAWHEPPDE